MTSPLCCVHRWSGLNQSQPSGIETQTPFCHTYYLLRALLLAFFVHLLFTLKHSNKPHHCSSRSQTSPKALNHQETVNTTKLGSLQALACAFTSCARLFTPLSRIQTVLYYLAHWPWEPCCPELCSPDCDKMNWSQAASRKDSFENTWKNCVWSGAREMFVLHVRLRLELAGWTSFISQPQARCNEDT